MLKVKTLLYTRDLGRFREALFASHLAGKLWCQYFQHIEDNNISLLRGFALYMPVSMRKGFEILYSCAFRIHPESLMR